MKQIAYLVRCNDNVVAVILNKKELASAELAALQWRDFIKHRTKFEGNFEAYLEQHHWRVSDHPVTERVTLREGPRTERTHVPETFPQPPSEPLPKQTQLKRKQLPVVKPQVFGCPICENQIGQDHKPGCPEAMPK